MAELWFRDGLNPNDPDEYVVAVVVDPGGDDADRLVHELWLHSYDGDGMTFLVRTDGWAEQSLDGDVLTVDLVVYPQRLAKMCHNQGIDESAFRERSAVDLDAVRVLRASCTVEVAEYKRIPRDVAALHAPPGTTTEQMFTLISSGEVWPLAFAPPPEEPLTSTVS